MIKGLKEMFDNAGEIQTLQNRSELFEKTLLKAIESLDAMNAVHEKALPVYENESLKKTLTPEEHASVSLDYATGLISWTEIKNTAEIYQELRKLYKEIYKKDAVTAPSSEKMVSLKKDGDVSLQFPSIRPASEEVVTIAIGSGTSPSTRP